jgi:hypothetical protein
MAELRLRNTGFEFANKFDFKTADVGYSGVYDTAVAKNDP